jgi:hypothetical protein
MRSGRVALWVRVRGKAAVLVWVVDPAELVVRACLVAEVRA